PGLLGQQHEPLQAAPHLGGVAAREIGPAAAPHEQDVAGDDEAVGEVAGAAHGVARGHERAQAPATDRDVVTVDGVDDPAGGGADPVRPAPGPPIRRASARTRSASRGFTTTSAPVFSTSSATPSM